MKRSKFSDSQIIDSVKWVEAGIGVPDMCRELASARRRFTNGGQSTAAWMCP